MLLANQSSIYFRRSGRLWYQDGNIVLVADGIGFKVYKGILARQSTVFADMLDIPQPKDRDMYDGCPVVVLPDAAEEMRCLLLALFDAK